jgi:hypothetical protein
VLLLLFCRPSQELVAQAEEEEEALLMTVEKQSSVSAAHNTTTHTYLLPTYLSKILKLFAVLFCCSLLFYSVLFSSQNKTEIGFFFSHQQPQNSPPAIHDFQQGRKKKLPADSHIIRSFAPTYDLNLDARVLLLNTNMN